MHKVLITLYLDWPSLHQLRVIPSLPNLFLAVDHDNLDQSRCTSEVRILPYNESHVGKRKKKRKAIYVHSYRRNSERYFSEYQRKNAIQLFQARFQSARCWSSRPESFTKNVRIRFQNFKSCTWAKKTYSDSSETIIIVAEHQNTTKNGIDDEENDGPQGG